MESGKGTEVLILSKRNEEEEETCKQCCGEEAWFYALLLRSGDEGAMSVCKSSSNGIRIIEKERIVTR